MNKHECKHANISVIKGLFPWDKYQAFCPECRLFGERKPSLWLAIESLESVSRLLRDAHEREMQFARFRSLCNSLLYFHDNTVFDWKNGLQDLLLKVGFEGDIRARHLAERIGILFDAVDTFHKMGEER